MCLALWNKIKINIFWRDFSLKNEIEFQFQLTALSLSRDL